MWGTDGSLRPSGKTSARSSGYLKNKDDKFNEPLRRIVEGWTTGAAGSDYAKFQEKYFNNLPGFVRDCFHWKQDEGPTFYQYEILEIVPNGRTCVRGPHGLGKTAMASWIILWYALTRDGKDWKVVTTASVWRQLNIYLWPEIHKWARNLRWDLIGRPPFNERTELQTLSLKLSTGAANAVASDNPASIEGAHADYLLYVFDESKEILAGTFDAAEGAFANVGSKGGNEALALAISTPGEPQGRFYEIQARKPGYEDWQTRRVTFDEIVRAGRATWEFGEQRKLQWGENSAVYQNKILGEFAAADEDSIIPLSWVERAVDRWRELFGRTGENLQEGILALGEPTHLGVDVGRGGDKTSLAPRYGMIIPEIRRHNKADTMVTAYQVEGYLDAHPGCKAIVDGIGIGAGVFDYLRKIKADKKAPWRVEAFIASHKSELRDQSGELGYINRRAAAWWNMRELLDPANGHDVALPPDPELQGELTAPHYETKSGGRIQVEDKEEIRKRIDRSTDAADGVIMAFARPEPSKIVPGVVAQAKAKGWTPRIR